MGHHTVIIVVDSDTDANMHLVTHNMLDHGEGASTGQWTGEFRSEESAIMFATAMLEHMLTIVTDMNRAGHFLSMGPHYHDDIRDRWGAH